MKQKEKIPLFLKEARGYLTDFRKNNILIFGHLAEGNLHYNISKPKTMPMSVFNKLHKKVNSNIFKLVYDLGGSFSAEHGIGLARKGDLKKYKKKDVEVLKSIKNSFDPKNIMNPGKIIDI